MVGGHPRNHLLGRSACALRGEIGGGYLSVEVCVCMCVCMHMYTRSRVHPARLLEIILVLLQLRKV